MGMVMVDLFSIRCFLINENKLCGFKVLDFFLKKIYCIILNILYSYCLLSYIIFIKLFNVCIGIYLL